MVGQFGEEKRGHFTRNIHLINDNQKNLTLSIDNKGKVFFTVTNPFQDDFLILASDDESSMLTDVIIVCHMGYTISCR